MKKDKSARRFQLTWNNPDLHGVTHEVIKETFSRLKSTKFFCMADEIGRETMTLHTHCYCEFDKNSPKRFSTLKHAFPTAHIEQAFSDAQSNIDYIKKEGKWKDSEKADTVIEGSYEQYGTPSTTSFRGQRNDLEELYSQIKQGATDYELLESNPKNMRLLNFISRTRLAIETEKNAKSVRELTVIYVFGGTSTYRLEYIFNKYGIENIYRFNDYQRAIFDGYNKEPILLLDNFKQGFPLTEMVTLYLSQFPSTLHCRYNDKQALYTTVIISSRNSPDSQYLDEDSADRQEFFDKLGSIIQLCDDGTVNTYTNEQYFDPERLTNTDSPFQ